MQKQTRDDRRFSFLSGKSRQWLDDELDDLDRLEDDEEHDGWSAIRPRRAIARLRDVIGDDIRV